jgi:hypothetical protein
LKFSEVIIIIVTAIAIPNAESGLGLKRCVRSRRHDFGFRLLLGIDAVVVESEVGRDLVFVVRVGACDCSKCDA